jgi:acyl-CoA synthetase (AMP-forming)/AMP-acid ligase II
MNLFSFLSSSARRYGTEGAVFQGTRRISTYAELHSRALRLAGALQSMGRCGDRVLIASRNCPQYPEMLFAIWGSGMVAVPVNAKLHAREILQIAQDSGARWIFSSLQLAPALEEASGQLIPIGSEIYRDMVSHEPGNCVDCQPEDLAWLFFTSGTMGRAKGAMLSHRNLTATSVAHVSDLECIESHYSIIHAAPLSHGSGLLLLPYTMRGARHVIPESGGFDPEEFLDLAAVHVEPGAFLAPTMVRRLRLYLSETGRSARRLRSLVYGGGPMYLDELKRSLAAFGPILIQLYGQGESPMTITGLRREDHVGASDEILR